MNTDHPPIRVIPPLALVAAILVALALEWLAPLNLLPPFPSPLPLALGLALIALALLINISGATRFLRAKTPINPFKTPTTLVKTGAYRFTRNPMYLGMVLLTLGIGPAFSIDWAIPAALALWAALHWGAVLPEEAFLSGKFGAEYTRFMAETRRWI